MRRTTLLALISGAFILLFTYAATSKLLDYEKFRAQLGQSPILVSMAGFVAWFIPVVELVISLALAFSRTRLWGFYGSLSLMTLFTGYIIAITQFSDNIPCSCGGVLQRLSWNQHLLVNLGFVALAMAGIALSSSPSADSTFIAINRESRKPA